MGNIMLMAVMVLNLIICQTIHGKPKLFRYHNPKELDDIELTITSINLDQPFSMIFDLSDGKIEESQNIDVSGDYLDVPYNTTIETVLKDQTHQYYDVRGCFVTYHLSKNKNGAENGCSGSTCVCMDWMTRKWVLNEEGINYFDLSYGNGNKKIAFSTTFRVASPPPVTVDFSPKAASSCTSYELIKGSSIKLIITNPTNNLRFQVKEAGSVVTDVAITGSTYEHRFYNEGDFLLEVTDPTKIWSREVTVKKISVQSVLGGVYNKATKQNVTFSLSPCLLYQSTDNIQWKVVFQNEESFYTGPTFTHQFENIGAKSVNANIKFSYPDGNDESSFYIQLYDVVEGLNATLNTTNVCVGDSVEIGLSLNAGSAVDFKYQIQSDGIIAIPTNPFVYTLTNEQKVDLEFYASNPISSDSTKVKLNLQKNEQRSVDIRLPVTFYKKINDFVTLTPLLSGFVCAYKYRWKHNTKVLSTGKIYDVSNDVPTLVHQFTSEGTFPVSLEILRMSDDALIDDAHTTVIIEQVIDFNLSPTNIVRVVGQTVKVEAIFTTRSPKVSYRWRLYGSKIQNSEENWVNDVSSNPIWTNEIEQEQSFILSLEVKNSVSVMIKNASVTIKGLRSVTFKLVNDDVQCFRINNVLDVEIKMEDNYNNLIEPVICKLDGKNYPVINPKITNPFKLKVKSQIPGIVTLLCALQNTEFNQTFNFYFVNNLDFLLFPSSASIMTGEDITAEVINPLSGVPYSWYLRLMLEDQQPWESIANSSTLQQYKIKQPGHYEIRVTVGQNAQSNNQCLVTKPFTANIPLQVKINEVVIKPNSRYPIKLNAELNFSASVNIAMLTQPLFHWSANTTSFPSSQDNGNYNYNAGSQGIIAVKVLVKLNEVNASLIVILDIQSELSGVSLSSQFGEHSNNTGNNIPADQSSLDLIVGSVPKGAVIKSTTVTCLISRTNATIYQHTHNVSNLFRISLVINQQPIMGEISCYVILKNSVSQSSRYVTFFIQSDTKPRLEVVDMLKYTGDKPVVQVRVFDNTLPASVLWYYGNVVLIACSSKIDVTTQQTVSCEVPLNDHADRLLVKVESDNPNGYESYVSLKSIRSFSISSKVIQVNLKTRITVDVNVSASVYHMKYGSVESSQNYIDVTETLLGNHLLNVTLSNRISLLNRGENLTVIDAGNIGIEIKPEKVISDSRIIKVFDGEQLEFIITNQNQFVEYTVFIDGVPVSPEPSGSYKYLFQVGDNAEKSIKNSTVSFRPKLNGVFVASRDYQVLIYRPISNVELNLPTKFVTLNSVYSFTLSWFGEDGNCSIITFTESDCISAPTAVESKIDQYSTYCVVSFETPTDYRCYNLQAVVSNIAGSSPRVWRYQPFEYIPLTFNSVNFIQRNQASKASIGHPLPNTTYNWFLVLISQPSLYNITLGESSSITYTIPNDIDFGEYAIQVNSLYQIDTTIFKTAMNNLLILPNTSNALNSTLQVNTTGETEFISIQLAVKNYYPGLSYNWSVCIKGEYNNCTGKSVIIGHNHTLWYHLPKNSTEGIYLFTVVGLGQNMIEPIKEQILYSYCQPRNISITPVEIDEQNGALFRSHLMSNWFYSEVKVFSECPIEYQWIIFSANDSQQIYQPKLMEGMQFIDNRPLLELPPRAFQVGNYTMRVRIQLGTYFPIDIDLNVNLRVAFTPLVPTIGGGSFRVIGNQNQVYLDASGTIDPDAEHGTESGHLVMKWDVPDELCYRNRRNSSVRVTEWSADNRKLRIIEECLKPSVDENDSYLHRVMVKREGQSEVQHTSQKVCLTKKYSL